MRNLLSFWNKFIVGFICFMMVNINLTIDNQVIQLNMGSAAYAQDSESSSSGNENVQQGKSGAVDIKDDSGGGLSFLTGGTTSFIIFMAASIVIGRMLFRCTHKTIDMYLAAGGAAIYIAGELMSMFGAKDEIDNKKLEYKTHGEDGKIDDTQYQALVKEKEVLQSVADAADKKSKFQMSASIAFGAAAASAVGLALYEESQLGLCVGAVNTAMVTVPVCGGANAAAVTREGLKQTPQLNIAKIKELKATDLVMEEAILACSMTAGLEAAVTAGESVAAAAAVTTACNSYIAAHAMSEPYCPPVKVTPATGMMVVFAPIVEFLDIPVDYFITTSYHRAALWGGLGLYGAAVSKATAGQADEARDNIKEIDKIINKMDNSRMESQMANSVVSKVNLSGALQKNLYKPVELTENMPCMSGSGTVNATTGQVDCPPAPKYVTNPNAKGMSVTGYEGMANMASNLVSGVQGQSSISPQVQQDIEAFNNYNTAIKKKLRDNLKKLNLARAASGKKPYDFNKSMNKTFGKLQKSVKKSLLKNGLTADQFMARAKLAAPVGERNDNKKLDKKEESITSVGGKAITSKGKKGGFNFDFSVDDEVAKKNAEFAKNEQAAAEVGDENEDKGDIIEDKSVSIFKVISHRYMKSGFNRLLDEL